ncbi:MAG TPA: response regulator [Burkholderiales bacterium]|nr:response regulator [Burkholderiales bacterium]
MRVLVCDDNRDNMLTLGVLLRSEGYLVHMAKNGAEALRLAEGFRPDVALLDLLMPDRSGFDVARELQRRYRNECPILVAVTAQDNPLTKAQAADTGFRYFVAKPYDPQALLRLVGSLDGGN